MLVKKTKYKVTYGAWFQADEDDGGDEWTELLFLDIVAADAQTAEWQARAIAGTEASERGIKLVDGSCQSVQDDGPVWVDVEPYDPTIEIAG